MKCREKVIFRTTEIVKGKVIRGEAPLARTTAMPRARSMTSRATRS